MRFDVICVLKFPWMYDIKSHKAHKVIKRYSQKICEVWLIVEFEILILKSRS